MGGVVLVLEPGGLDAVRYYHHSGETPALCSSYHLIFIYSFINELTNDYL